jgi:hypothetical protein
VRAVAENGRRAVVDARGEPAATAFAAAALMLRGTVRAFGFAMFRMRWRRLRGGRVARLGPQSGRNRSAGKSQQGENDRDHESKTRPGFRASNCLASGGSC